MYIFLSMRQRFASQCPRHRASQHVRTARRRAGWGLAADSGPLGRSWGWGLKNRGYIYNCYMYKVVPPSYVCWFIIPINCSYNPFINQLNANELGHHLVSVYGTKKQQCLCSEWSECTFNIKQDKQVYMEYLHNSYRIKDDDITWYRYGGFHSHGGTP